MQAERTWHVRRRYQMRRIETGDYLLWSNDGKTLWRVQSYLEGKSAALVGATTDWTEWRVSQWSRSEPPSREEDFEPDACGWAHKSSGFRSRQEAIEYALTYQPAPLPANPRPKPSIQDAIRALAKPAQVECPLCPPGAARIDCPGHP